MSNAVGYVGVQGTIAYVSGGSAVGATTNRLIGATLSDGFTKLELKTGVGDVVGIDAITPIRKATFEFIPYDSAGNPVTAAANVKVPDRLCVATAASSSIASLDGDWNYVGEFTITPSTDGYLRCSMPCEKYGTKASTTTFAALS